MDCFPDPKCYVEDDYATSKTKVHSSGIRQGCPLSPCLFVLVMGVIDHDIGRNMTARTHNVRFEGLDFDRVLTTRL